MRQAGRFLAPFVRLMVAGAGTGWRHVGRKKGTTSMHDQITRRSVLRLSATIPAVAAVGSWLASPLGVAAAKSSSGALTQRVSGTVSGVYSGTFGGLLTITKFVPQGGQLSAVGTLAGTVTNALTGVTQAISGAVNVLVTSANGTCQILYLHTGEIYLDVLGLVIDIQPITITITAQQGAGNLLGNLLCAIANLLNGGAPLTSLTQLLNELLAAL